MNITKLSEENLFYKTKLGSAFNCKIEDLIESENFEKLKGKVQLIFTSPPFPLNRKKKYGNFTGDKYLNWLSDLATPLSQLLTENGSIVIELGNAWVKGKPVMSTLAIEALLEFKKRGKLFLCQEFICHNPARLPSPAQWVNIERIRVKDSYTRLWWLSPSERPKADNKKVLTEYSSSMKQLLKTGNYNSGRRPSEHNIGDTSFTKNNGGAIPPNFIDPLKDVLTHGENTLELANTKSSSNYQTYCRDNDFSLHPARMQDKLVEFFIKFLTDEDDIVLDPFAGSNTTGAIAEILKRNWIALEPDSTYLKGSIGRFSFLDNIELSENY